MFRIKVLVLAFFLTSLYANTQNQQFDRASYYSFGVNLFAEAHGLPDTSPDSVNILVLFKVSYNALVFIQANPLDNPGSFQAVPSVEVFFRDDSGIIRNRTLWTDTIWAKNYDETKSKDLFVSGYVRTKLTKSEYTCTVQLLDRYRNPADKSEIKINAKKDFLTSSVISSPIFVYSVPKLSNYKSVPFILGNKINFTSSDAKILLPVSYIPRFNVYNYIISKKLTDENNIWNDTINISGRVSPSDNSFLDIEENSEYTFLLNMKSGFRSNDSTNTGIKTGILSIELPSVQLSPGNYNLTVVADGTNDTAKFDFEVIWVDMPLALRNPAYAIEAMYYILTDEEFKEMKSASDEDKPNKLMNYWKAKDPTKSTPYNEVMNEYFKRVDYAFFNYQTLKEKDGSKTERGKIYILYNKPDSVDKALVGGKQYEIWTYKKLGKVFHFELVSNGLYILTKIDG